MISNIVVVSAISMGGIGAILAVFLVFAERKLRVEEDPMVEALVELLPNTNCGGCGYPGCRLLAENLLNGTASPNACVAAGNETAVKLAEMLGVELGDKVREIAVVLCKGGAAEAGKLATYRGELSCTATDLIGGDKGCSYGCLGYGECVDACNFDAMAMDPNGLPVVFHDKCVGCGCCVKACPRDIIEMHPEDQKLFVYCRNKDKGAKAKKVCTVACIACTLCVKDCGVEGGIVIKDNLAIVDNTIAPQNDDSTKRCPTKCIFYGIEEQVTREAFYSKTDKKAV